MRRAEKWKSFFTGVVFIVFSVSMLAGCAEEFDEAKRQLDALEIETPRLSAIPDGRYTGTYRAGNVLAAKTEVLLEGGRIMDIVILEHKTGLGRKAESIIDRVIEKQSLDVEAVSGATHSSKVILGSLEKALTLPE